ncbi:hypothetical protein BD779DRAFT_1802026 [Infundibulicybe gibba]|nr:hypothetical protein BD779DRAFT_1802026 [Infundibulicybe gibba]
MHIKSTINAKTTTAEDVPVAVLTLVHTNPQLRPPGSQPTTAATESTTIADRAFVCLPDSYTALLALARATFGLPPHTVLRVAIGTLDICRGAPVRITKEAYPMLRGVLDIIRVEVIEETQSEREKQRERKDMGRWDGQDQGSIL